LFIDTVGYSKLLIDEQRDVIDTLNQLVRSTAEFRSAEAAGKLIKIATGDGMVLVFYNRLEAPVECALEISRALKKHPELQLRMGVHSGPVSGVIDVNERANVAGHRDQRGAARDGLRRCRAHSAVEPSRTSPSVLTCGLSSAVPFH